MICLAKIVVTDVRASAVDYKKIPAGIVGATVEFEFLNPIWDGLDVVAVFRGNTTKAVPLNDSTAVIPWEVVAEPQPKQLEIGLCGVDADKVVIIPTLWAKAGWIYDAADPDADPSLDPSMPIWAELEDRVGKLEKSGGPGNIVVDGDGYLTTTSGGFTVDADGYILL